VKLEIDFEKKHIRDLAAQNREVVALLNNYAGLLAKDISRTKNPRLLKSKINAVVNRFADSLGKNISDAIRAQWNLANEKNDELVQAVTKGLVVSPDALKKLNMLNYDALKSFTERKEYGMNLSDRVWNLAGENKTLLEAYTSSGIASGRSAASISRDVQMLLNEPDKLFLRVRDASGRLILSKAEKAYHPGTGVYRSSYKNALRMAQTETNMAYRASDSIRRQQLPFVIGIEVKLSAAHPENDICDAMAGEYPVGFFFEGWHPKCLCYTTSVMLTRPKIVQYFKTGEIDGRRYVRSIPEKAGTFVERNLERFSRYENPPYFLKNFDGLKLRPEVLSREVFNPYEYRVS
jgi:hypothetical protein